MAVPSVFAETAPHYWGAGLPAIPLRKKAAFIDGWTQYAFKPPSREEQKAWMTLHGSCNVGLVLGPQAGVTVVDVDTDDPQLQTAILALLPPSPWKRVGSKGMALAYRFNGEQTRRIKRDGKMVVEILGQGAQIVLPPSIHPDTNRPYTENAPLHQMVDQLLELPIDIGVRLEMLVNGTSAQQSRTREGVWAPVPVGGRDDAMVGVAGMLGRDAARGARTLKQVVGEMIAWVESCPERRQGDDLSPEKAVAKVVQFFKKDCGGRPPDGWDRGLSAADKVALGLDDREGRIRVITRARGGILGIDDLDLTFQAVWDEVCACLDLSDGAWSAEDVREMVEAYAGQIRSGAEVDADINLASLYVYVSSLDRLVDRFTLMQLDERQFDGLYGHRIRSRSPWRSLLSEPSVKRVTGITYRPGGAEFVTKGPYQYLNTWMPPAMPALPGDLSPFLDHISYLMPMAAEREHFLDWLAHVVQYPDRQINHAVVVIGTAGTGKSYLETVLAGLLGEANVGAASPDEVKGRYTGWVANKVVVVLDELMTVGRRDITNHLKRLITAPKIRIEEKYAHPYLIDNVAKFIAFSNYEDAICLDDGDRRFWICHSPAVPRDASYYDGLFSWTQQNLPAINHYLLNRDLSRFNPMKPPPVTPAKLKMVELSQPPLEQCLKQMLDEYVGPFAKDIVITADVMQALPKHLHVTPQAVTQTLKRLGAVQLPQMRVAQGYGDRRSERPRPLIVRNHDRWEGAQAEDVRQALAAAGGAHHGL